MTCQRLPMGELWILAHRNIILTPAASLASSALDVAQIVPEIRVLKPRMSCRNRDLERQWNLSGAHSLEAARIRGFRGGEKMEMVMGSAGDETLMYVMNGDRMGSESAKEGGAE